MGSKWGGYQGYRYGAPPAADRGRPCLRPERRDVLINMVTRRFQAWTLSPFEFEASHRHGIRSALCLAGNRWTDADFEAAVIVGEALQNIGAKRPTWDEGQPVSAAEREGCRNCGRPMASEDEATRVGRQYCSPDCAKAAHQKRFQADAAMRGREYMEIHRAVSRARNKAKRCAQCGGKFHPRKDQPDQKYCSLTCLAKARVDAQTHLAECPICHTEFVARHVTTKYCGRPCSVLAMKIRAGWVPKSFTRVAFDHFICEAA